MIMSRTPNPDFVHKMDLCKLHTGSIRHTGTISRNEDRNFLDPDDPSHSVLLWFSEPVLPHPDPYNFQVPRQFQQYHLVGKD